MARPKAGVMPCTNKECRYPTRPDKGTAEQYPNTRRRRSGQCSKCYEIEHPHAPKKKDDGKPPQLDTLAGLEAFLAGRRRREAAAARRQYPHLYRKATA